MSGVAIACDEVWKSYRLYHQRSHTLKEKVLRRGSRYEEFWALKGVDIEVREGATFGIIGANGSGKSTLLKTMARILTPNRGSVVVNGSLSALLELGIGFHPELTGRENVFLSGSLMGHTKRDVASRYDDIVEFAGIQDFMDTPVKNYSTGMYARLAFATAISSDPEILLIDEVLSVGDASFQMRCYERLAELRTEGRTIVLVSHSLESIKTLCAEAAWLKGGEVQDVGESHDVVAAYLKDVYGEPSSQAESFPGHRFGSGEILMTDVTFLDGSGARASTFRTGEPVTIRIGYSVTKVVDDALCSFAVYRAEDMTQLIGKNTQQAGLSLDLSGEGTIEVTIPELPLLSGSYLVSLAIHDEALNKTYDWHDRRYSFIVFENPALAQESGLIHVESRWTVTPSDRTTLTASKPTGTDGS